MQKILISACLLGEAVRYDGKHQQQHHKILHQWIQQQRVISFCPEVAGGLPVPRVAAEIVGGDGIDVLSGRASVMDKAGENISEAFIRGAQSALAICKQHHIKMAILARRSPSCGNQLIYDGTFSGTIISGMGVTAALLKQHDIWVFNQDSFEDAAMYLNKL